MREIKFRAWDKKGKIFYKSIWNLQWCLGGIRFAWDDYKNSDGETMITDLVDGDYELMQFTGLLDKNGKEIYDGDICAVNEMGLSEKTNYEVKWMKEYPAFDLDGWEGDSNALSEITQTGDWEIEVIGNIYETPELLTPKPERGE